MLPAAPAAVGAKSTWMVQDEPAATAVLEHPSVAIAKGAPAVAVPIFKTEEPEFVTMTDWLADVVPTSWLPKARLDADSETAGWTACPLSATVCGELEASSWKASVASWYGPEFASGAKLTCTVQAAPTDRVAPEQVSAERLHIVSPVSVVAPT